MEFWTRHPDQPFWKKWPDALGGLSSLGPAGAGSVLLVSDRPDDELSRLMAMAGIVKKMAGDAVSITVASPYPAKEWIGRLRDCGIDHFWTIQRRNGLASRRFDDPDDLDAGGSLCPALHVNSDRRVTVSVCGRHGDRMVLARHHLERWCLNRYADCPHWQREEDA